MLCPIYRTAMDPWCAELGRYWVNDGDFNRRDYPRDEDDYEPSELVDSIYTSEWTGISTVEEAKSFVLKMWEGFTENEKAYVAALYLGRDCSEYQRGVATDMLDESEALALYYEAERDEDIDALRRAHPASSRKQDVGPPFKILNEQLAILRRHRDSVTTRPSGPENRTDQGVVTVQAGGSGAEKLYRLMALADSLHDFGDQDIDKAGVQAAIGADIPTNLERVASDDPKYRKAADRTNHNARKYGHHDFLYGDSTAALEFIADEAELIKFLNDNSELHFDGEPPIKHNMYGIDLLRQFDKRKAFDENKGLYWLAYLSQRDDPAEAMKADVWALPQTTVRQGTIPGKSPPKNHKDVVFISQIIYAVRKIKAAFGDGKITFVMDKTDNQIHRMLLGSATLYAGIGRMLIVIGWKDELMSTEDAPTPRDNWSIKVCDASLLDGNTHFRDEKMQKYYPNPEISEVPTGDVFQYGVGNVRLGGVIHPKSPMVKVSVGNGPVRTHSHKQEEFSISKMAALAKTNLEQKRLGETADHLACKRACDWGQVRHCALMDELEPDTRHVFVSPEDRMACLYSVYANVDTIFIKCNNDNNTGWAPFKEVLQTTFTLCPKTKNTRQDGGGIAYTAQACLVAAMIALSFMGR